jgi:hypothetical protein
MRKLVKQSRGSAGVRMRKAKKQAQFLKTFTKGASADFKREIERQERKDERDYYRGKRRAGGEEK